MSDDCYKEAFSTRVSAKRKASQMRRQGRRSRTGLQPYRCRWCGQWHLTSKPV